MSGKNFIDEIHSLTTENQLEFRRFIQEFKNGKELYEIMNCDMLPRACLKNNSDCTKS